MKAKPFDLSMISNHLARIGQATDPVMYLEVKRLDGYPGGNYAVVERIDQHGNYCSFREKGPYDSLFGFRRKASAQAWVEQMYQAGIRPRPFRELPDDCTCGNCQKRRSKTPITNQNSL